MTLARRLARLMAAGTTRTIPRALVEIGINERCPDTIPLIPAVQIERCYVTPELRDALVPLGGGAGCFSIAFDGSADRDPDPEDLRGLILANVTEAEAELLRSARTWLVIHGYGWDGGTAAPVVARLGLVDNEDDL